MALPNIPSLPTDNLYKFLALFGLILMMFSIYLSFQNTKDSIEWNDRELSNLTPRINELMRMGNLTEIHRDYKNEKTFDSIAESWTATINKLKEKNALVKNTLNENYIRATNLMFYFGMGMMVFGFGCWYFRVQKPLDELTKMEIAKMKIDILKSKPTENVETE